MAHVVALYRYPVKSFTPESCEALTVLDNGRVAGDRVLGVRFASTDAPDDAWSTKHGMLALMNTPGLARLQVRFHESDRIVRFSLEGVTIVEAGLDPEGRERIGAALAEFALAQEVNPLDGHPERLPLRVVGDGVTPRYHDNEQGEVTLHGRGSLQALGAALGRVEVSELRFRSNIAVEGVAPWGENEWIGRQVRVGTVQFEVARAKVRCLATQANPETGRRDLPVLTTLTHAFRREQPTFAVALRPIDGGEVRLGDEVTVA